MTSPLVIVAGILATRHRGEATSRCPVHSVLLCYVSMERLVLVPAQATMRRQPEVEPLNHASAEPVRPGCGASLSAKIRSYGVHP